MRRRTTAQRGITLIELVIVVAIVGILGSLAYPAYQDRARRAKRTDAKAALINIAAQQERFFLRNNRYAASLDELGTTTTENEFYALTLDADTSTFTATATAVDGQALDERCATFTINQLGQKGATGEGDDPAAECWR